MVLHRWSLFLLVTILLFSCKKEKETVITPVEDIHREEVYGVKLLYSDSAQVILQVQSDTLLRYAAPDNKEIFKGHFVADFFDSDHSLLAQITSRQATRYPYRFEMVFEGDVVFKNEKGEKLQTEVLHYSEKDNRAFTDHYCKITNVEEEIYGFDFEATEDFSNYRLKKMTGRVKLKNPE